MTGKEYGFIACNGGKDLTYDEYVQLLSHAASNYNNGQIQAKGKRQVYLHKVGEDTFDANEEAPSDYEPFDIDTPVETIQECFKLSVKP
jgi:hypothetical protein